MGDAFSSKLTPTGCVLQRFLQLHAQPAPDHSDTLIARYKVLAEW